MMALENTSYEPPQSSSGDHVHLVARMVIGSAPLIGSAAVELFQALIIPPLEKRQQAWMEAVANGLRKLENAQRINIDDLSEDEVFFDTVMYASQVALRNSSEEKRQALRNAILNSALPNAPDESRQQMFISWVDQLTAWHLRILHLFSDPRRWFHEQGRQVPEYHFSSSLSGLLCDAYPELSDERALYDQIWKDLYTRGLVNTDGMHVSMSGSGAYARRTSELAEQFLKFINEPAT